MFWWVDLKWTQFWSKWLCTVLKWLVSARVFAPAACCTLQSRMGFQYWNSRVSCELQWDTAHKSPLFPGSLHCSNTEILWVIAACRVQEGLKTLNPTVHLHPRRFDCLGLSSISHDDKKFVRSRQEVSSLYFCTDLSWQLTTTLHYWGVTSVEVHTWSGSLHRRVTCVESAQQYTGETDLWYATRNKHTREVHASLLIAP